MNQQTDQIESALKRDREHLKETVHEIEERMTPGRLVDELLEALKAGPADFTNALGRQLRDKPLPAVLTGVGLSWLMLSDRHPQPRGGNGHDRTNGGIYPTREELEGHAAWERYQNASWDCVRDAHEDDDAYENRLTQARAKAADIQRRDDESDHAFRDRVHGAAEKFKSLSHTTREKLSHAYDGAAERVSGAASAAAHAASSTAHAASSGASTVSEAALSSAAGAKHFHEDHPLASGAIGLAIGALIGSALPLSREEHDRLKGLVDEGLEKGAKAASHAAEKVEHGARRAEDVVSDHPSHPTNGGGEEASTRT